MMQYIKFTFENVEPLKIADDGSSQSGQINSLSYVPGSTLRGAVVNAFARTGELDSLKSILLSDEVAFLNAYIMADEIELIPSLKGFYEDKTDAVDGVKQIENFLPKGKFTSGNKRASLGRYCYMKDNRIHYTGVKMGSDMKINKGKGSDKKNVFRNEYIVPGYRFAAYIATPDSHPIADKLERIIKDMKETDSLMLGGSRSFGYGKCKILKVERTDNFPYAQYAVHGVVQGCVYMALISNTTMINEFGVKVGIDLAALREKLGLEELKIENCATSVVDVRGYNRTWQTWTPAEKMYEMGSVFKLVFPKEEVSNEKLNDVMDGGIGIRVNEGYGRVLFLNQFEQIAEKKELVLSPKTQFQSYAKLNEDEEETLKIVARGYYRLLINRAINVYLANPEKGLEKYGLEESQLGTIESILYANLYNKDGFQKLREYFATAKEKDDKTQVQKNVVKRESIAEYIESVREKKIPVLLGLPEEVMGLRYEALFSNDKENELNRIKQKLIISQIKRMNRGGIEK